MTLIFAYGRLRYVDLEINGRIPIIKAPLTGNEEALVKHIPFRLHLIIISAILMLALSSCVLPVPREDGAETPIVVPTAETTIIIPTAPPVADDAVVDEAADPGAAPADDAAADPAGESPQDPAEETPAETSPPPDGETTHVVQAGETLGEIAELYDISVADLAAANGITDVDTLDVGQKLVIKAGAAVETPPEDNTEEASGEQVHIVQSGENLFRIGLRYGFTAAELAAYNNIPDVTRIDVGQIIKIPPK